MARVFCYVRYEIDPAKRAEFEEYGRIWTKLVKKTGGEHLGYFMPAESYGDEKISFPGVGRNAPDNVAIALFSFPDRASYDAYRRDVKDDPECARASALVQMSKCFAGYERGFFEKLGTG